MTSTETPVADATPNLPRLPIGRIDKHKLEQELAGRTCDTGAR